MSRAAYSDDGDEWSMIRWAGAVKSAIRGRRGQVFLKDLLAALDALPAKRLIDNSFQAQGEFCALGAVANVKGIDLSKYDPEYPDDVCKEFGIADALAREVMWQNDEGGPWRITPEKRFEHVRRWVVENIKATSEDDGNV